MLCANARCALYTVYSYVSALCHYWPVAFLILKSGGHVGIMINVRGQTRSVCDEREFYFHFTKFIHVTCKYDLSSAGWAHSITCQKLCMFLSVCLWTRVASKRCCRQANGNKWTIQLCCQLSVTADGLFVKIPYRYRRLKAAVKIRTNRMRFEVVTF